MMMFSDTAYFSASLGDQNVLVEFDQTKMSSDHEAGTESNTGLMASLGGLALLSLVAILLFKQRQLQLRIIAINYLIVLAVIVFMYWYSLHIDYFEGQSNDEFQLMALLPLALLFFNYLAGRGVKKDIKLLRSMDRLR